jgi:hypothetical protein
MTTQSLDHRSANGRQVDKYHLSQRRCMRRTHIHKCSM